MKEIKIKIPNTFGKEIEVTKEEYISRWQDSTVKSLMQLFRFEEYNHLKEKIREIAAKEFDRENA